MAAKTHIDLLLALAQALRMCGGVDGVRADDDCGCTPPVARPVEEASLDSLCLRLARAL